MLQKTCPHLHFGHPNMVFFLHFVNLHGSIVLVADIYRGETKSVFVGSRRQCLRRVDEKWA
jgi:hypothetical protein